MKRSSTYFGDFAVPTNALVRAHGNFKPNKAAASSDVFVIRMPPGSFILLPCTRKDLDLVGAFIARRREKSDEEDLFMEVKD